jgi:hypothetical protein
MYAPHSEQFVEDVNSFWFPLNIRRCSKRCSYLQYWNTARESGQGFLGLEKHVIFIKEPTKEMNIERLFIQDK